MNLLRNTKSIRRNYTGVNSELQVKIYHRRKFPTATMQTVIKPNCYKSKDATFHLEASKNMMEPHHHHSTTSAGCVCISQCWPTVRALGDMTMSNFCTSSFRVRSVGCPSPAFVLGTRRHSRRESPCLWECPAEQPKQAKQYCPGVRIA